MELTERQIAHVLAALRYCQGRDLSHMWHFDQTSPLTDEEVDELVDAINFGEAELNTDRDASPAESLPFTVIGLLPDSEWDGAMYDARFVEHVTASTPTQAGRNACLEAARKRLASGYPDAESSDEEVQEMAGNIEILAVFAGHLPDLYDRNTRE